MIVADKAGEAGVVVEEGVTITAEQRTQIINGVTGPLKGHLQSIADTLTKKSTQDFMSALDKAADFVGIECKQPDKSLERSIVFGMRHSWTSQLEAEQQPPLILLLACQILVLHTTKNIIKAPGDLRCHPLLSHLTHNLCKF